MKQQRAWGALGLLTVTALALSACGSGGDAPGVPPSQAAPSAAPTQASTPATSAPATPAAPETTAAPTVPAASTPAAPSSPASTPAAPTSEPAAPTSASASESAPAAAGKAVQKKASSAVVTDPVLEDKIQVTGIATGFTGSGTWATPPAGATYVALKIKVQGGDKYYTSASCTSVQLGTSEMSRPASDVTASVKADMRKQGLDPFVSPEPGGTREGYCMYYVKAPTDQNLKAVYSRLGLKGGGKTYPAFEKDLALKVG